MRLACVYVPELALQAVLRRAPEARGVPAALLGVPSAQTRSPRSATNAQSRLLPNQDRSRGAAGVGAAGPAGQLSPNQDGARGVADAARPAGQRSPNQDGARGVAGKPAGKPRVVELSAEARRAGVVRGMTPAQAQAACPGLRLLEASPADLEAAEGALADVGYAFAPRVEQERERVFFAVEDLGHLYPLGEQAVAQAVQAQAARVGLEARVSIASGKGVARVGTRAHELSVVPEGARARAFLADVSVDLLTPDVELRAAFRRWGTRTAAQVAALPADAVALRLGEPGARVCRLARGEDDEPFMPLLPADALEEAIELDYRVTEIEPLAFVLRGLVDRALARLAGRSLACAGLTVRLTLDPRGLDVRAVPIAAPTRDSATLIQLLRLDLARRPPDAPVIGARLVALPARVRATQLDILRPAGPAPDRLAATIARLAALVGPANVGAPAAEDTWREEAALVTPFALMAPAPSAPPAPSSSSGPPALAIRRLRPAQEIEVLMGRGGPTALRGRDTTARVLVAAGPYRASGEWWRGDGDGEGAADEGAADEGAAEGGGGGRAGSPSRSGGGGRAGSPSRSSGGGRAGSPSRSAAEGGERGDAGWAREYWDVHASDGAVYRVHQSLRDGRWFLDGYYD
jgi:protein ImuB